MSSATDILVLDELETLLPPLSPAQRNSLEESLIEEGRAYSPLWIWIAPDGRKILVDGHNRLTLCLLHGLPYETREVFEDVKTLDEVKYRLRRAAVGQRNLPRAVEQYHIGQMIKYKIAQGSRVEDAVREVAYGSMVSNRTGWRSHEKVQLMEAMPEPLQTHPAVQGQFIREIKLLSVLDEEEQLAVIARAGESPQSLKSELHRMSLAEWGVATQFRKKEEREEAEQKRQEVFKKSLFVVFDEQMAKLSHTLRSMRKPNKIPRGEFSRVYDYWTRLEKAVKEWEKAAKAEE